MFKSFVKNISKFYLLFPLILVIQSSAQVPQKASAESILEFLELIGIGPSVTKSVEVYNNATLKRLNGKLTGAYPNFLYLTSKQQKIHTQGYNKIRDSVNNYYSWKNLKGISIPIYQNAFTQKQMDDLIAFAKTPTGNMYWKKINEINFAHESAGAAQGAAFENSINKELDLLIAEIQKSK